MTLESLPPTGTLPNELPDMSCILRTQRYRVLLFRKGYFDIAIFEAPAEQLSLQLQPQDQKGALTDYE